MRKDVMLRLVYDQGAARLSEIWLSQYDDRGELVAMVQLDHTITEQDRLFVARSAFLLAHIGQLQAF